MVYVLFLLTGGINTAVRCAAASAVHRSPATNSAATAIRRAERAAASASVKVSDCAEVRGHEISSEDSLYRMFLQAIYKCV